MFRFGFVCGVTEVVPGVDDYCTWLYGGNSHTAKLRDFGCVTVATIQLRTVFICVHSFIFPKMQLTNFLCQSMAGIQKFYPFQQTADLFAER